MEKSRATPENKNEGIVVRTEKKELRIILSGLVKFHRFARFTEKVNRQRICKIKTRKVERLEDASHALRTMRSRTRLTPATVRGFSLLLLGRNSTENGD